MIGQNAPINGGDVVWPLYHAIKYYKTKGPSGFSMLGIMWGNPSKSPIYTVISRGNGGDEGIRTLERLHVTPLAGERLRPLGHVSVAPFREGELRKQDQNGPKCSYLEKSMVLDPKTNLHVVWSPPNAARFSRLDYQDIEIL